MSISVEKFVAPVQELGALNVANIEKLISLQVEAFEEAAKTAVESLKKASAVKDLEGAKAYFAGQSEVVKQSVESAVARSKSVAEIAQAYPAGVKKIVDKALAIG
jgi:phasin family protein